ncbi:MAG: class I SAM-dependent methyltransferase [Candidatus Tectomicrobia bacterium]|uniref:Class I SAM-dependent methyltransferase n=1 Tax=Tectimicrobiota bacterium TaxID=2528274 RepID=A0A938AZU4_UNCTE|nr:class I SAM-dependent methyltransferase [Candidatus Tectomicrobia bacterium]
MTTVDKKAQVQQFYGAHASAYTTSTVHAQGPSLERLVTQVAPKGHEFVLDVATGTGHNALSFAPHVRQVIGLDLTAPMLAEACGLAQKRALHNVRFFQGDSERLPFADASFDVVTCRVAPHHFPDVASAIREMARVCRPEGCIALVDNITPEDAEACAYINAWETVRDPSHHWAYPLSQWRQFFQQAGLLITYENISPKPMEFVSWATRMGISEAAVATVRHDLFEAPAIPRAWLQPRLEGEHEYFDLTEALFIARKA